MPASGAVFATLWWLSLAPFYQHGIMISAHVYVLLFQALSLTQNLLDLYGARGVVQWEVMDSTVHSFMPRLSWVSEVLGRVGISDAAAVKGVFAYRVGCEHLVFGDRTDRVWGGHAAFLPARRSSRQSITRPGHLSSATGFRISRRADTVPPSWLCPAGPAPCSLPAPQRARPAI